MEGSSGRQPVADAGDALQQVLRDELLAELKAHEDRGTCMSELQFKTLVGQMSAGAVQIDEGFLTR